MAISGAVNGWHQNILEVVKILYFHVFNDIVPVFPLAPGFEVKNKLKYQPLNWRKGIKLAIQRLGEGKFCSSFTKYYFPNTFKQYFNNQTALKS